MRLISETWRYVGWWALQIMSLWMWLVDLRNFLIVSSKYKLGYASNPLHSGNILAQAVTTDVSEPESTRLLIRVALRVAWNSLSPAYSPHFWCPSLLCLPQPISPFPRVPPYLGSCPQTEPDVLQMSRSTGAATDHLFQDDKVIWQRNNIWQGRLTKKQHMARSSDKETAYGTDGNSYTCNLHNI